VRAAAPAAAAANASTFPTAAQVYRAQADLYTAVRAPLKAAEALRRWLGARAASASATLADAVEAHAAIATDLREAGRWSEALEMLDRAAGVGELGPEATAILAKLQASVYACKGEAATALSLYESAKKMRVLAGLAPYDDPVPDALQHIDLLRRAATVDPPPPPGVAARLNAAADRIVDGLLRTGPWRLRDQLPRRYVPGLAARPWHDVDTHFPALAPARDVMVAAAPALAREYNSLRRRRLLERESECIHDAARGDWKQYAVNGYWHVRDDAGCAVDTPAACALLATLRALPGAPLIVLRAGYSMVEGTAHLHPHFGMTNAQLKFHIGLVTPLTPAGDPCATMRVANETRGWRAGEVWLFDDSFEHEVVNACDRPRAIMQVVIAHPDYSPTTATGVAPPPQTPDSSSAARAGPPQRLLPHTPGAGH